MSDSQERNLPATPQRMKEARRKGKLGRSQDLSAWVGLAAAAVTLPLVLDAGAAAAQEQLAVVRDVAASPDTGVAVRALGDGLRSIIGVLAPLLAVVFGVVLAVSIAQGGLRPRQIRLHFDHFKPVSAAKRLFGAQAWWMALKTLLKSALVGVAVYVAMRALVPLLAVSGDLTLGQLLWTATDGVKDLLLWGVGAGIAMALLDLAVVIRRNRKQTRMTLREFKDENKRTEGDPLLKGAIRSRQLAMSRNRMMAEVADADVVLVNPTHVAVALRYQPGAGAPRVVAKGAGAVASAIRARALENRVPLVEDVPLARALHAACDIGQEIPEYLFTAVARVLAFVMNLRQRGAAAGSHRMPQASTVPEAPPRRPGHRGPPRHARTPRPSQPTATRSAA
ncbi:type III secretion protein [Xylanimonas oleitrophica]|uniref:Type III secretion protein n=1 Tax=Xylanimonas oleitrophica TaxID=2607479 RepID=A0A2W5YH15_9MICO|nr:EscU/YscU/HrcU family type III secretion system export apparatus switch protein [Xylanimonas oleitrophica]PZR54141.1 type III secretion protein [Xylanimonas oleitrophica]